MHRKSACRRPASAISVPTALLLAAGLLASCTPAWGPASNGSLTYRVGTRPIQLYGEWERFPGFLDEAGLASGAPTPALVEIRIRDDLRPRLPVPEGPLTYRLLVRVEGPRAERDYAFTLPGLAEYKAVIANGRTLYAAATGGSPPPVFMVRSAEDRVSILVHCDSSVGCLERPLRVPSHAFFGEAALLGERIAVDAAAAFAIVAFFFVVGMVLLLLFAFWRKNLEFLALGGYLVACAAFYYVKYAAALRGFPGLDPTGPIEAAYTIAMDVEYLGLVLFLISLFHAHLPRFVRIGAIAAPLLFAALALAAGDYGREAHVVSSVFFVLLFLSAFAFIAAQSVAGNRRARWTAAAFVPAAASFAYRIAAPESFLGSFVVEPAGHMVFAFVAMLMLVKKTGESFESVETLSDYVADVTRTVSRFIPREFLEYLDKRDVTDLRLGDHVRKEMTIFFSDIRSFTELSEKLTVEENFAFVNSYLSRVVPVIEEHGGFVDKYVGDGIMALFAGQGGADQAIRTAISIHAKIREYNGHRAKMGYRPISMGVGVHTGALMLGVVGVQNRMENTVISDAVNLTSRLQAITKAFNVSLAISEQAFKELDDPGSYKYRFIGKVKVKGKAAPISVFEIFDGIDPELFERKMRANMFFEQGMLSYYQKDFAGAMYYFKRVLDVIPEDGAASFYLDNCMSKASL